MIRAFVDTGGWYGYIVEEDRHRPVARRLIERAAKEDWSLYTTDDVVFETYALLVNRARNGHNLALHLLDVIEDGLAEVVHVTEDDVARSIALVQAHRDKTYSLCDASSFVVMERLRIRDAIAFDDHFRQFGRINVLE